MGKRRNTAKTGDKKLYKSRAVLEANASVPEDDEDPIYDEVDKFHNDRDKDFLKLDAQSSGDEDDEQDVEEAVMDLAGGVEGSSSEESDDSSSDEEEEEEDAHSEENGPDDLSSSSSEEEELDENVRDWGRKKSSYYHGDTADLEIGQDEEDAELEEEAAKEVQAARYKEMSEDDFVLSDDDQDEKGAPVDMATSSTQNLSKLSMKDKQKLIDKQHPELLPLVSHFSGVVRDLHVNTSVAVSAVFEGEEGTAESIGATKLGQQYLLTKALLQSSAALNLAMYLLLKAEHASDDDTDASLIQSHPVMLQLQKLNKLSQNLEDNVENKDLTEQLGNLVKAAALLNSSEETEGSESESDDEKSQDSTGKVTKDAGNTAKMPVQKDHEASSESESDESSDDEVARSHNVLTEARFGLRLGEVANETKNSKRRRLMISDAGDDDMEETEQKALSQSLATTLNSIEQRSASRKRRAAPNAENLDEHEEDDGELRRGLEMMEAELGKTSDDEDDLAEGAHEDPELDDDDGDDFYAQASQKSKSRKERRKELYRVAPKFPRVENEITGERAISKVIMKNRGLVAHKSKLNRNPRVKKREQYRKALIRRKGAVRDVRTDEGHKYGGEETGIKTGLSRSRKLAR